jgi:hypothetical protein
MTALELFSRRRDHDVAFMQATPSTWRPIANDKSSLRVAHNRERLPILLKAMIR